MPIYRYSVRMIQQAVDQLSLLWSNNPSLRSAITHASNDMDRILGMGPANQGRLQMVKVGKSFLLVFSFATGETEVVEQWEAVSLMPIESISHLDLPVNS